MLLQCHDSLITDSMLALRPWEALALAAFQCIQQQCTTYAEVLIDRWRKHTICRSFLLQLSTLSATCIARAHFPRFKLPVSQHRDEDHVCILVYRSAQTVNQQMCRCADVTLNDISSFPTQCTARRTSLICNAYYRSSRYTMLPAFLMVSPVHVLLRYILSCLVGLMLLESHPIVLTTELIKSKIER